VEWVLSDQGAPVPSSSFFEGDSVAKMYVGNWSDYEAMMEEKFANPASSETQKAETINTSDSHL